MVETNHAKPSTRDGRRCTREADRFFLYARGNVGAPTSQWRQISSLEWYTGYMALMSKGIEIEPSSFEEAIQQPMCVDAMVEKYDSIIKNSAWEVV